MKKSEIYDAITEVKGAIMDKAEAGKIDMLTADTADTIILDLLDMLECVSESKAYRATKRQLGAYAKASFLVGEMLTKLLNEMKGE